MRGRGGVSGSGGREVITKTGQLKRNNSNEIFENLKTLTKEFPSEWSSQMMIPQIMYT